MRAEILQDPSLAVRLQDTKASAEVKALDDFYHMLQHDPNRAFYGCVVAPNACSRFIMPYTYIGSVI